MKKYFLFLMACIILFTNMFRAEAAGKRISLELTAEEQDYVKNAEPVSIALSPDNYPYSSLNDGEMTGIFVEMIQMLSYETGLQFEILPCQTYREYADIKEKKEASIVFATHVEEAEAEELGYRLTSEYLNIPYSKIELRDNQAKESKVAVLQKPSAEATMGERYYYSDQIMYCDSKQECLDNLNAHTCEAVILNSYDAEDVQYSDVKNQYVVKELYDNQVGIFAGIRRDDSVVLYNIMDKALNSMDETTKQEIINRNTQQTQTKASMQRLFYTNPMLFFGILILFCIMVCSLIFLMFRVKNTKLERQQDKEYRQFMGYICAAVNTVTELNLKDHTMTRYLLENDKIVEEFEPYPEDIWLMFHEDDRPRIKELFSDDRLWELCQAHRTVYEECRMKWSRSKEEYHWCTTILQGITPTKEKPFHLLLLLKDTNELKEREAKQKQALEEALRMAKQSSESKGSFLSNMSHEIRTPLNAIIGYLSLAKDEDISHDRLLHCIDNCDIASRHLLQIINDVLDMSSIESGKLKIAQEDFDLKKEIMDITTIFFQNAKNKNVVFETQIVELTREWVVGDQLRLNQVLMNLLSNAVKFTPEQGHILLKVQQLKEDDKKVYIQFQVCDTGIGMSEEYMARIFKPFEQENAGTAKKYGGSGLGLSITNNLVHMMGGTISVESKQGEGTAFTVTMHFDQSQRENQTTAMLADYANVRVLVVDDQKDEGTYVKTMLKRCGVKADIVTSGAMALKRLKSRAEGDYAYNLCIIDWNMPEMDGCEVTRKIREELGNEVPVIIATAYDIAEFEDDAKAAGANKVVAKPLFQSTLFDLLVSTFGKYSPKAAAKDPKNKVDMTGVHVLLAEDNPMNMEIAVTTLEKAGIVVDQATNGEEACRMFLTAAAETYDLILMDVQMPVMDGYEATKKIRSSDHEEAKTIPIIAMTANAFAEDVTEALARGMNAHIAKPINYDKLFQVLQEYRR